jgi:hypothetical protein
MGEEKMSEIGTNFFERGERYAHNAIKNAQDLVDLNEFLETNKARLTREAQHNLNEEVNGNCEMLAQKYNMEPYLLQHILTDSLADIALEDEYVEETLGKLLVYVKMKRAEEIQFFKEEQEKFARRQTEQNMSEQMMTIRKVESVYERQLRSIQDRNNHNALNLKRYKEWLISQTNSILNSTNDLETLSPRTRKFIDGFIKRELVVWTEDRYEFNQQKFLFELTDLEFWKMSISLKNEFGV